MKEHKKPAAKVTCAEPQHSVDNDPTFLQMQAERDQRRLERQSKRKEIRATLLRKLADAGYHGSSLEEIVERNSPLSSKFVETLLALLPETSDARVQEMMVRHLIDSAEPFDGRALVECFGKTDDEGLRWAILNTIAIERPHSINDWIAATRDSWIGEELRKLS